MSEFIFSHSTQDDPLVKNLITVSSDGPYEDLLVRLQVSAKSRIQAVIEIELDDEQAKLLRDGLTYWLNGR